MSGALATQTPPWPTAMPEGMFSPSVKRVTLSTLPSPSVSSRILMRSRPGPAERRGYSRLSVTQMRPRSSNVIATGLTRSGSAATSSTRKPGGTSMRLIASAGDSGSLGGRSCPCGIGLVFWADKGRARNTAGTSKVRTASVRVSEHLIRRGTSAERGEPSGGQSQGDYYTRRPVPRGLKLKTEDLEEGLALDGDGETLLQL